MSEKKTGGIRDGIDKGLGMLSAFKEAIDETINEARERGDLSQDRAKEIMREALDRAQEAADGARDRFDFVTRKQVEGLRGEMDAMGARLRRIETHLGLDVFLGSGPAAESDEEPGNGPESPGDAGGSTAPEEGQEPASG
jgi:polyhydroxyalkanoate synthesis regulator phasin